MTFSDDRDSRLDELLRATLRGEADSIQPAGDGLARIQSRIDARRSRLTWMRPLAVLGGAAVVAVAGFTAYAVTRSTGPNASVITQGSPSPSASVTNVTPTPSPSKTVKPAPAFPSSGFYPFSSSAQEASWESQQGPAAQPWLLDPTLTAKYFVADFVHAPSVTKVIRVQHTSTDAHVTLGRTITGSQVTANVTTVHLVRVGKAWVVVGASDPRQELLVGSPASGARITSPVTVRGPQFGVETSIQVDVRSMSGRISVGAPKTVSFGAGTPPWSTKLVLSTPTDAHGAVVATETSSADGGPGRIVAIGVQFDSSTLVSYPQYFYGINNGRVAKFSSRTGASLSYLTATQPGGGATDPQLVGDRVYYLQGAGTCSNTLMSVSTSGGAPQQVQTPQSGYTITSYAVSADGTRVAVFDSECSPGDSQPQGLLVSTVVGTNTTNTVSFQAFPPVVVADPSWEPDGQHLDAIVRTGNLSSVVRYDAFAARSWSDATSACPEFDRTQAGEPTAIEVDSTGALWFAAQAGGATSVYRCIGGAPAEVFSTSAPPDDVDVTAGGGAVLLADNNGKLWRWTNGGTTATPLTTTVAVHAATW